MSRRRKTARDQTRAIACLRVSTEEQDVRQQRDEIERWAATHRITVEAWFADEGVSGAAPLEERLGLLDAMAALKSSKAGLLVFWKRDRIARDVGSAAAIERLVSDLGVRLVTADGVDASDSPEGQFMRTIFDAIAQYERACIRVRTRVAMRAMKKRGEVVGTVPFGYRREGGLLVEHEREQQALARMRLLRLAGATHKRIAASLQAEGYEPRGRRWHATTVQRALAAKL